MKEPTSPAHLVPPVFTQILDDEELAPRHLKVWRAALPLLDFVTPRPLTLDVLEHSTGIDRANLSRLVARLVERGYLVRAGREGRMWLYRVPLACPGAAPPPAERLAPDDAAPAHPSPPPAAPTSSRRRTFSRGL